MFLFIEAFNVSNCVKDKFFTVRKLGHPFKWNKFWLLWEWTAFLLVVRQSQALIIWCNRGKEWTSEYVVKQPWNVSINAIRPNLKLLSKMRCWLISSQIVKHIALLFVPNELSLFLEFYKHNSQPPGPIRAFISFY